ncbi:MAG: sulfur carrier protein ThiS [Planctomycetaceae bacterium]
MRAMMTITVNDENRDVPAGTTLADLLDDLGRKAKFCAVERNRELVPRAKHGDCVLSEGDRLEIVTLVGGG